MEMKKQGTFVIAKEDVQDQDMIVFKNEGKWEEGGQWGKKFNMTVELPNKEEKTLSVNNTSINNMIDEYGKESKEWIMKEARVHIVSQMVGKEMKDVIYLSHPNKDMKGEIIHE